MKNFDTYNISQLQQYLDASEKACTGILDNVANASNKSLQLVSESVKKSQGFIKDALKDMGNIAAGTLGDILSGQEVKWDDVLRSLAAKLADLAVKATVLDNIPAVLAQISDYLGSIFSGGNQSGTGSTDIFPSILTSILSGISGRASGGSVSNGQPYIVGEQGPELFLPQSSGNIISNQNMAGFDTGRPINVNMYISTPEPQSFQRSQGQIAAAMMRAMAIARRNN